MDMMNVDTLLIGRSLEEIILHRGYATVEQLAEVYDAQQKGHTFESALYSMKILSKEDLLRVQGEQVGVSVHMEVPMSRLDPSLLTKVPVQFAKRMQLLPLYRSGTGVVVACTAPYNMESLDQLSILLESELFPQMFPKNILMPAIQVAYDAIRKDSFESQLGIHTSDVDEDEFESIDIDSWDDEAPVIAWVNSMLRRAVKERASDIHIEPLETEVQVRFRRDGVLQQQTSIPKAILAHVVARLKVMSELDITEKRLPQDGRIQTKLGDNTKVDIRLSTIPTSHGESIVMRLLFPGELLSLDGLGFSDAVCQEFEDLLQRKEGIILVTGPTGAGKTTTLSSAIHSINTPDKKILTAENPIEYEIPGVMQVQINPDIGLSFAKCIRAFLRQDPDIMLVGELRDEETSEAACRSALTGHLVLATLHTNHAAAAFSRLMEFGIQSFLVASAVIGVLGQRLLRRVCPECCEEEILPHRFFEQLGAEALYSPGIKGARAREGGCEACFGMGYHGRVGIYELLLVDETIREQIMSRESTETVKATAVQNGMKTFRHDGIQKIIQGLTTVEELLRAT